MDLTLLAMSSVVVYWAATVWEGLIQILTVMKLKFELYFVIAKQLTDMTSRVICIIFLILKKLRMASCSQWIISDKTGLLIAITR